MRFRYSTLNLHKSLRELRCK